MQLTPDGIVGAQTWKSLYDVYQGIQQNIPLPKPEPGIIEYTVVSGDTLWSLARRFGTTVDAIKRQNGLTGDLLQIGQKLKIPTSQNAVSSYTIVSGDTLWSLAKRFGTTVDAIKRLNGLTGDEIFTGQTLLIPG